MAFSQKDIDNILTSLDVESDSNSKFLTIDEVDQLLGTTGTDESIRSRLPSEQDSFEVYCMKKCNFEGTEPDFRESWSKWVQIQKWKHFIGLEKLQDQLEGILRESNSSGSKKKLAIIEVVRGSVFPSLKAGEGVSEALRHHVEVYATLAFEHFFRSEEYRKKTFLEMDDLLVHSMNEEESNYAYMICWLFWRVKETQKNGMT